jgi:hypothetical protein
METFIVVEIDDSHYKYRELSDLSLTDVIVAEKTRLRH